MKKTLLTIAATAGIALGGVAVAGTAGAQSYGDSEPSAPAAEDTSSSGVGTIEIVPVQDEADPTAPEAEADEDQDGRRGRHGGRGCNLEAAAETIGISEDELRAALDEGNSIADVATTNGVDPDAVVDAMVAEQAEKLTAKVEAGDLTQEEADERLADKTENITDQVFDSNDDSVDEEAEAA